MSIELTLLVNNEFSGLMPVIDDGDELDSVKMLLI
jgi:hypothetical protein